MGAKTDIEYTNIIPGKQGATWNPMRAINLNNGQDGYFCIPHGPGCLHCWADDFNRTRKIGNGLRYSFENLEKVKLYVSGADTDNAGQTAVDWPMRSKISQGIFTVSMSDWMGEFWPVEKTNLVAISMMLSQHHIFITLTKRDVRLAQWLDGMTDPSVSTLKFYNNSKVADECILKARGNLAKFDRPKYVLNIANDHYQAPVPWPPPNVIFGITITSRREAEMKLNAIAWMKKNFPNMLIMISYEPALETIDWATLGYQGLIDWLTVGGESGEPWDEPREIAADSISNSIEFGKEYGIPVFVKQMGAVAAQKLGLKDTLKGTDVPEEWCVRQFPDVTKRYIPWKK